MSSGDEISTIGIYRKYKDMIPVVNKTYAVIILVLNIFFPGFGTMAMGFYLYQNFVIGILQFVLSFCIIGWIWSVIWGVTCVMKCTDSSSTPPQQQTTPGYYNEVHEGS